MIARKWIIVIAAVVIVGLGLGLGLTLPGPKAPETIKIGCANPDTGMASPQGAMARAGFELAVQHINEDGGVYVAEYGKRLPLELIILDDESDPTKTVTRLESLYARGVVATVGAPMSHLQAAAAGAAEVNKVPHVGCFGTLTPHQQGYRYIFSPFLKIGRDTELSVCTWLQTIDPAERPTKLVYWKILAEGGGDIWAWWQAHADDYGLEIVYMEEYAMGTSDFTGLIMSTMAALDAKGISHDQVIVHGFPLTSEAIAMITQSDTLGFNPKVFWFIRGPDSPQFGETLGDAANGVFVTSGWHYWAPFPGVDRLNAAHEQIYGTPADPIAGSAYGAIQVLADAIERAGTLDSEDIRDAVAATDMVSVMGPIKFDDTGMPVVGTIFCPGIEWQEGEMVLIFPSEHGGYVVPVAPHIWR